MQPVTPFLMFNGNLGEALKLYTSVFKKSKVHQVSRGPKRKVMSATFTLNGQKFLAYDGGPHFSFSHGVSFFVECKTQKEIDYYWRRLAKGGQYDQCGWLRDKFGLSWQIIPAKLIKYLNDKDRAKANRVMQAMLEMSKIDIKGLDKAYKGK